MAHDVQKHSVHTLVFRSLKRSYDMFMSEQGTLPPEEPLAETLKISVKTRDQYGPVLNANLGQSIVKSVKANGRLAIESGNPDIGSGRPSKLVEREVGGVNAMVPSPAVQSKQLTAISKAPTTVKPTWHAPWKLYRVISGHAGWVRSVAVEPGNQWFVTGSSDRTIKIWDLATCKLKLSLTGHVSAVRGLAVSARHPYLFSAGEDKKVMCWDLEMNKVIRQYHGHLSAVHDLTLHPTIDILLTCGRDSTIRVWDMRTKACIHTLVGHTSSVAVVRTQPVDPQIVSGSHDSTIRLWDLAAGKTMSTLTNHKKSVRGLALHPSQFAFASASPDNIKQWKFPAGEFLQNLTGHSAIVNTLAVNADGVLVSAADNGSLNFWDWKSGYNFQKIQTAPQPGSLDSENGVFASCFDMSGSRYLTAEADKTIKIYKEREDATEESDPVIWKPQILKGKQY